MKILEICPFSAGICGVWARVLAESREFARLGHEVRVFSSNIEKGNQTLAKCDEDLEGIAVKRFSAKSSIISKNVTLFDFENEFLDYKPDIVITHLLHPHSFKALKLCNEYKIPCYLVTHAPFNVRRGFPLNIATSVYNYVNVKPKLQKFTKIIAVTKWEMPYLLRYGAEAEKIAYIPNGLPEEFFKQKKARAAKGKDVLFLGRVAPVKNIENLLMAAKSLPKINFSIVGSAEKPYLEKIKRIIEREKLQNVRIYPPVYDLRKKIKLIDEHNIFVLPSTREAMPQVLLEAMARGRVVISSKTDGGKEIINENKNGLLFEIGNYKKLSNLIRQNIKGNKIIGSCAKKEAEKYAWSSLIKCYILLFNQLK